LPYDVKKLHYQSEKIYHPADVVVQWTLGLLAVAVVAVPM
jgi:hypothetical protein